MVKLCLFLKDCIVYNTITATLSGLCVAWYYVASPEKATLSLNNLNDTVFAGALALSLHAISAVLFIFLIAAFIFVTIGIHLRQGGKFRLLALSSGLLMMVCLGIATGAVLTEKPWAIAFLKRLVIKPSAYPHSLPPLFDAFSLYFSRAFLCHAVIVPVLAAGLVYFLAKHSSAIGPAPVDPIVKHSTRLALYMTFVATIAYFLMGPLTTYR